MAKIHRFIGDFDLKKEELNISGDIAKQISLVLKLKIGEKIELCDGKGISVLEEIVELGKNKVTVKKVPTPERVGIPTASVGKNYVTLFCSVLKKENFELVVQKSTECGVSKIIPIISARTIKTGLNVERLQKIAKEASEQSGRTTVPEISEPIDFTKSLELVNKNECNFLFDSSGNYSFEIRAYSPAGELLCSPRQSAQCISKEHSPSQKNIFIGPEGGWTIEEIEKAKKLNFKIASLGPLTLRGETAAIVATYLLAN